MTRISLGLSHLLERINVNVWILNHLLTFSPLSLIWWQKNHTPEHPKQKWLQINRHECIFLNRNTTFWQFIALFEKNSLIPWRYNTCLIPCLLLTHPSITFDSLKDSKNPCSNLFEQLQINILAYAICI